MEQTTQRERGGEKGSPAAAGEANERRARYEAGLGVVGGGTMGLLLTIGFEILPASTLTEKMLIIVARLELTRQERAGSAYADPEELLADLRLVQDSLIAAGDARAAHGELQQLVWLVETFGFHLAELEVRPVPGVHTDQVAVEEQLTAAVEGLAHVVRQWSDSDRQLRRQNRKLRKGST